MFEKHTHSESEGCRDIGREREKVGYVSEMRQGEARIPEYNLGLYLDDRVPTTYTITFCLPESALAGIWNHGGPRTQTQGLG